MDMTPSEKYAAIVKEVEQFLQERAARYFQMRHRDAQRSADLLQAQCDSITAVFELLEPHMAWFAAYDHKQREAELATLDLHRTHGYTADVITHLDEPSHAEH